MSNIRLMGQVIIHHIFWHVEFGQDIMFTISTKKKIFNVYFTLLVSVYIISITCQHVYIYIYIYIYMYIATRLYENVKSVK